MASPIEALKHDASRKAAVALVEVIIGLLLDDERRLAREEFYLVVRAAFEEYEAERLKLN